MKLLKLLKKRKGKGLSKETLEYVKSLTPEKLCEEFSKPEVIAEMKAHGIQVEFDTKEGEPITPSTKVSLKLMQ